MNEDLLVRTLGGKGFFCDARVIERKRRWVVVKDGELELQQSSDEGIAVRALVDGAWGHAFGKVEEFEKLLGRAERLAGLVKGNVKYPEREGEEGWKGKRAPEFGKEELEGLAKESFLRMEKEGVRNRQATFSEGRAERVYANSAGELVEDSQFIAYAGFSAVGKEGDVMQEGNARWGSLGGWEAEAVLEKAGEASRKCAENLKAEAPPSGNFAAVFDNDLAGVFVHEAVGHACEGDSVSEGTSVLKGKKGQKIGSGLVTIWDNPALEGGFGSYAMDSEGVGGKAVKLIDKGVLEGYMHSEQSAAELGEKGNGHARAEGSAYPPIVRMSNTYMESGELSFEELADISEGLYIRGMSGGSVDTFTGQFMFRAEQAFWVKQGEVGGRIRDLSITGTVVGTLEKVSGVGKDFALSPGFCGKGGQMANVSDGGPHIRVSSIRVG